MFVIDASIAAKWFLADEASSASDAVLERIENGETAVAPDVFRLEIQNVLLSAERNSRIPSDEVDKALDELRNLPIHLRPAGNRFIPGIELGLARAYGLTPYGAAYLACADDLNAELVTADAPLERAARSFGIATVFVP